MQLGKNGLTNTILKEIKKRFEKRENENMKIHVLKAAREKREDVKKYADEIQKSLGDKFTHRVVGFSIFIKKWRRAISRDKN